MTEPTLDEIRARLARALPQHAAFDGWSAGALRLAADATDVDPAIATLAFPGGPIEMIDAWFSTVDDAMTEALSAETLAGMRVGERVRSLVEQRIDILVPDVEALRRALAVLAFPWNLPRAAKLDWRAADVMWRAAGDKATDYNHYTKRTLLGGIYAATIIILLDDTSDGYSDTRAFLSRRLAGIARFEKLKAKVLAQPNERLSLARFLGRLRYPVV